MKLFKLNENPILNNELMETGAWSLCFWGESISKGGGENVTVF